VEKWIHCLCKKCDLTRRREITEGVWVMDYSVEGAQDGVPFTDLPLGFGMGLAQSEAAMRGYASLTEAQKEEVLLRCKDVKTREQMQKIVDSLVPGADVQAIYQEERERFS